MLEDLREKKAAGCTLTLVHDTYTGEYAVMIDAGTQGGVQMVCRDRKQAEGLLEVLGRVRKFFVFR